MDFFRERGHEIVPSAPLTPARDPSLLFTSAGMVQFKPLWSGTVPLPYTRAASVQKCLRLSDLELVGKRVRYNTFFEMLGNFSFADYFKKEAIQWAWEFLVQVLGLPQARLWVSVLEEDDESYQLWRDLAGLEPDRIIRLGEEDNFWGPAGATGACGPCSEIFWDLGEEIGCGRPDCRPGCDCDRYFEVWNLVFPQFDMDEQGNRNLLKNKGIDTGMGLERLACAKQDVKTIFQTDLFQPLISELVRITDLPFSENEAHFNIIADHIRALTFAVSEGVFPSNEGRGYAVRRILRRALSAGKNLGLEEPFLYRLVGTVAELMKEPYPELVEKREQTALIVKSEEERFLRTLDQGTEVLKQLISELRERGQSEIPGEEAFRLYDTYGHPVAATLDLAGQEGFSVDMEGFLQQMNLQKERAKASSAFKPGGEEEWEVLTDVSSRFVGYEETRVETRIVRFRTMGESMELVLERTPFWAEEGGQVGDTGRIYNDEMEIDVLDTQKGEIGNIHIGKLKRGSVSRMSVTAEIDWERRKAVARNHTGTHLLQAALRRILGDHVRQEGSLVTPDRLRFDFTHFSPVTRRELDLVEELVNSIVRDDLAVEIHYKPLEEAKEEGAIALFGEAYGEIARVLKIGDFSKELCGGTHLSSTGEIGLFKIRSEIGIAAGIRRIEALTGEGAYRHVREEEETLSRLSELMGVKSSELPTRLSKILEEKGALEVKLRRLKEKLASTVGLKLLGKAVTVDEVRVIASRVEWEDMESLRQMADELRLRTRKQTAGVLGTEIDKKAAFVSFVTDDLTGRINAGDLAREVAKITGGGGGGKAHLGEAGGRDVARLDEAISRVPEIVKRLLGKK